MADPDRIEVALVGAQAERTAAWFTLGTPVDPISVGTRAQWAVAAEGVAPVHLYLGFDGHGVLIAAASPALPVLVAGSSAGTNWVRVPLPCEVRFGAASLMVRRTVGAIADDPAAPSTASDGGALWQLAQRAVNAARAAQVGPEGPRGGGRDTPGPRAPDPGPGPRPDFGSTLLIGTPSPVEPRAAKREPIRPSFAREDDAAPVRPSPARSPDVPARPAPHWPSPLRGGAAPSVGKAPNRLATKREEGAGGAEKKNFWAAASPIQRITWVLMPFALAAAYLLLQEPPSGTVPPPSAAPSTRPATTATSRATPGTADDAAGLREVRARTAPGASSPFAAWAPGAPPLAPSAPALPTEGAPSVASHAGASSVVPADPTGGEGAAVTATAAAPRPVPGAPKTKTRTPERAALDAAASGNFDEAAREYDALGEAHPEQPSYREAARILHWKATHARPR